MRSPPEPDGTERAGGEDAPARARPPDIAGPLDAWSSASDEDFRSLLNRVPGIWAVDKPGGPGGPTSHDIVERARRVFRVRRIGHAGTLDPLASGLLLLLVGRATRLMSRLERFGKSYDLTLRLGLRTDSYDVTGAVVEEREVRATEEERAAARGRFRGEILQVPPMFSALTRGGRPLYELARRGETVEREPRRVVVSRLDLVGFSPPEARLSLDCSKGTYVRSLAEDLGRELGCGAAVAGLRRTRVGPFTLEDALSLDELARRAVIALAGGGRDKLQ